MEAINMEQIYTFNEIVEFLNGYREIQLSDSPIERKI